MKKTICIFTISSIFFTACSTNEQATQHSEKDNDRHATTVMTPTPSTSRKAQMADSAHNVENSLEWEGEYEGILPCADCEGIKTELELHADKTYELTEEYLGKGPNNKFKVRGLFHFDAANPSLVVLDQAGDQRKYFIGESFAELRDRITGEKIDSKLNYTLKKDF